MDSLAGADGQSCPIVSVISAAIDIPSKVSNSPSPTLPPPPSCPSDEMGTFDAEGNYVPRQITEDDLQGASWKT